MRNGSPVFFRFIPLFLLILTWTFLCLQVLAIFDLLTRPDITLSEEDKAEVKKVEHELLATLKREKLVLDWRKKQQAQAAVQKTVRDMFYYSLPTTYTEEIREQAYAAVYQHIYDSYYGEGRSIYVA